MKYLLDTYIWIWIMEGSKAVPEKLLPLLKNPGSGPFGIAAISPWEVAKKVSTGKLGLSIPLKDWLRRATENPAIRVLPQTPAISLDSCFLPGSFHKDPADQLIVATARVHQLTLITSDRRILSYQHVNTLHGH